MAHRIASPGAPGRTRTCDPRLRRPLLYPAELRARFQVVTERDASLVGAEGFEPPTSCSQSRSATRLRHAPRPARMIRTARVAINSVCQFNHACTAENLRVGISGERSVRANQALDQSSGICAVRAERTPSVGRRSRGRDVLASVSRVNTALPESVWGVHRDGPAVHSPPRMVPGVNDLQPRSRDVRVDLGGRYVPVSEKHLNHTQIGSVVE